MLVRASLEAAATAAIATASASTATKTTTTTTAAAGAGLLGLRFIDSQGTLPSIWEPFNAAIAALASSCVLHLNEAEAS